jgi:hypothetical protein
MAMNEHFAFFLHVGMITSFMDKNAPVPLKGSGRFEQKNLTLLGICTGEGGGRTTAEKKHHPGTQVRPCPTHQSVSQLNTSLSTVQDGAGITHLGGRYSALRFEKHSDSIEVPSWTNRIATGGVDTATEEGDCL